MGHIISCCIILDNDIVSEIRHIGVPSTIKCNVSRFEYLPVVLKFFRKLLNKIIAYSTSGIAGCRQSDETAYYKHKEANTNRLLHIETDIHECPSNSVVF